MAAAGAEDAAVEASADSGAGADSLAAVREEDSDMARMTLETFAARVAEAIGPRLVTLLLYGSAARSGTLTVAPGSARNCCPPLEKMA